MLHVGIKPDGALGRLKFPMIPRLPPIVLAAALATPASLFTAGTAVPRPSRPFDSLTLAQGGPEAPIFRFEADEFWLNLHHFLYVLGRADAKMADAAREAVAGAPADEARGLDTLTSDQRRAWRDAVAFYAAGPSRKDLIFDGPLAAITQALADADAAASLSGTAIDAAAIATLERAAPIYRQAWWPAHRASNHARQSEIQALVDRHGRAVLQFITRAYGMEWPAQGYPVHFSAWANWAGAYSSTTGKGNLLVVSSRDRGTAGALGLETVFHEGMHQWDSAVSALLGEQARRIDKRTPPGLSHAMIFFTAGEAVKRVIAGHVPAADALGVWGRGFQSMKAPIEETWKPYLDGQGTRDEALAALVARTALERRGSRGATQSCGLQCAACAESD